MKTAQFRIQVPRPYNEAVRGAPAGAVSLQHLLRGLHLLRLRATRQWPHTHTRAHAAYVRAQRTPWFLQRTGVLVPSPAACCVPTGCVLLRLECEKREH